MPSSPLETGEPSSDSTTDRHPSVAPNSEPVPQSVRLRNFLIAMAAIVLSVAMFVGLRTQSSIISLDTLAAAAVPLETALQSQKPTLIEFYANWCTTCQAMAADVYAMEEKYRDRVNFVMLNVDNTKWLPEILQYRVDGIPHFVFLDAQGELVADAIGEQPREILVANVEALVRGEALPYAQASVGQTSNFNAPVAPKGNDDPRGHSS